jgi:hypothetical protein
MKPAAKSPVNPPVSPAATTKTTACAAGNCCWLPRDAAAPAIAQLLLLLLAGWLCRHALNSDGIAYLRIASYYADGRFDLAVSGYWGPMLSWFMAPFIKMGMAPLTAGRIVMGLSAVWFFWGCREVFRSLKLSPFAQTLGLWLVVALSVLWSVENITPDLLMSGWVALAFRQMADERWLENPKTALFCGLFWGLAYWAKAPAFPLAWVTTGMLFILWLHRRTGQFKPLLHRLGLALGIFLLVAGAWIAVLSAKYHRLILSSSARVNHALVGPSEVAQPYQFGTQFDQPGPGRITVWEDPTELPYRDWSPWASWANARHQLSVIESNLSVSLLLLTSISLVVPVLLVFAGARLLRPSWRQAQASQTWWWAAVPVFGLAVQYLPGNLTASEQRYFYVALPFLIVLSVKLLLPADSEACGAPPQSKMVAILLILFFLLPTLARPWFWGISTRRAGECAWSLAQPMKAAKLPGPVAGSGYYAGGRVGLYLAYLLGEPWLGDETQPTAAGYLQSGATLIVVHRRHPVVAELQAHPRFENLERFWPPENGFSPAGPLAVYRVLPAR